MTHYGSYKLKDVFSSRYLCRSKLHEVQQLDFYIDVLILESITVTFTSQFSNKWNILCI